MKFLFPCLLSLLCLAQQPDFDQHLEISKEEYAARREALRKRLDHPLVFMGGIPAVRINDTDYPFRQDSNFFYLTGYDGPYGYLILSPEPFEYEGKMVTELLFVQENNSYTATWVGKQIGKEGAVSQLGFQAAADTWSDGRRHFKGNNNFEPFLSEFAKKHRQFYLETPFIRLAEYGNDSPSYYDSYKRSLLEKLDPALGGENAEGGKVEILPRELVQDALVEMRQVKSERELAMLQRAVDVTMSGHRESLRIAKDVPYEYQVEAAIEFAFKYNGADAVGYNSIVGCGANGTVLHYETNRDGFDKQQMFVLDAGAEYANYTADVTRSFPADGTFSKEQREIYGLVLAAQKAAEKLFVAGNTYPQVEAAINEVISKGLVKLGLISYEPLEMDVAAFREKRRFLRNYALAQDIVVDGKTVLFKHGTLFPKQLDLLPEEGKLQLFDRSQMAQLCPHGWGHSVGLDVHDAFDFGVFRENMVFTIEPGIYISNRIDFEIDPAYMNIGVRIEDMYRVTAEGNVHMTADLPREVEQVEAFMKQKSHLLLRQHDHGH